MIIEHESNPSWAVLSTPPAPAPRQIDEIEGLMRRYPMLSSAEMTRCIEFIATAPIAERGALSSRPGMAAKMAQLRGDHPKPFRPSLASYAIFGTLIVTILMSGFMVAG